MNKLRPAIKFVLAPSVVILLSISLTFILRMQHKLHQIKYEKRSDIINACRECITNQSQFQNDNSKWGYGYENDVVIVPPLPSNLPKIIRDLHPSNIIINNSSIRINLSIPFRRIYLYYSLSGKPNENGDGLMLVGGFQ